MGTKQLYNDNLRKLPNEYGDVSVMPEELPVLVYEVPPELNLLNFEFTIV